MKKHLLLSFVGLMTCLVALAAPEAGKYYRIINASYGTAMSENYAASTLLCTTAGDDTAYEQLWQVVQSGTSTGLQNVFTGHYVQAQNTTSRQYSTGSAFAAVSFSTSSDSHTLMKCGGYMHCDAQSKVVKWDDTAAEGDHWTLEEVTISQDIVDAARAEFEELSNMQANASQYSATLQQFFTDNSCSELQSAYASMSDAELKSAMAEAGLPSVLQDIAVKVKNSWSDELDSDMSKQFRIQEYGAYSAASLWRWNSDDGRGLNASQINDMNNPTGIYSNSRGLLYVFVGSDVPTGCELRLAGCTEGSGGCDQVSYTSGTVLQKGFNVIFTTNDVTEYWVMYTLTDKTQKPADMDKMKIHIEGGNVCGYINAQDKDEATLNAEYERILKAANASCVASGTDKCLLRLALKGNRGMCYWQVMTFNGIWSDDSDELFENTSTATFKTETWNNHYKQGFNIYKSIYFFDSVLRWEWGAMGFMKPVSEASDSNPYDLYYGGKDLYPTYCNNLALTLMGTGGGNPYSTTGFTHMPGVWAVESSYNGERANFDVWCVGHESGHNNQGAINLESSTESSNNLFSNIITYQWGYRMSRGGSFSDNETYFQDNAVFGTRDIGMTMRMYYNLYLYYHLAGNKQNFYPTLFNLLRQDPIKFGGSGWYDGPNGNCNTHHASTSWLHFYKKACEAAQEDLTEYFRFWGFFIPCDKLYLGDYSSYYVTCTQAEIDEAIAWVKAQGWTENKQIMFIEDRLQLRDRTDIWADSETTASHKVKPDNGGTWRTASYMQNLYGTLGDVLTYPRGSSTKGSYTYIGSGQNISVTGTGGVGFLVYDNNGTVVAHANSLEFTIPLEAAKSGYTIKVVNADGSETTVVDAAEYGTPEQKKEALQNAIAASKEVTALEDKTDTKVGYYSSAALTSLKELVSQANTAIANADTAQYYTLTKQINAECLNVKTNGSMLEVQSNGIYTINSYRSTSRYLNSSTQGAIQTTTSGNTNSSRWLFIPTGNGTYYIQNYNSKLVMNTVLSEKDAITGWTIDGTTLDGAFEAQIKSTGSGQFYIENVDGGSCINLNGGDGTSIAVWSEDDGSKWYITKVKEFDEYTKAELQALEKSSDSLVNALCTISSSRTKVDLQASDKTAAGYIFTNKPDADTSHSIDYCLDNSVSTYFLTDHTYTGNPYIQVDLGEGNETDAVRFQYYTPGSVELLAKPTAIKVQGSTSGSSFANVTTFSTTTTSTTKAQSFYTDIQAAKQYRYWRFTITETNNEDQSTPYIALTKLFIYRIDTDYDMKEGYEGLDTSLISAVKAEETNTDAALEGLEAPLNYSNAYVALKSVFDALNEAAIATDILDIKSNETATSTGNGAIYDLTGRRVKTTLSGHLYIQNGKVFRAR